MNDFLQPRIINPRDLIEQCKKSGKRLIKDRKYPDCGPQYATGGDVHWVGSEIRGFFSVEDHFGNNETHTYFLGYSDLESQMCDENGELIAIGENI